MRGGAQESFDLIVIGGGMTGLALACATAGAGLGVLLVERRPLAATLAPPFDGRVTAIAQGSRRLLEAIGVWPALAGDAQPIRDIRVGERHSPLTVHYDHREVGDQPLGHIVENRLIRTALLRRAGELAGRGLTLLAPATVARLRWREEHALIRLADGRELTAALVAAAEGRASPTRAAAAIEVLRWDYRQTGIVATLAHERPHRGLAVERFFPDGPFAILPMTGRRSSIVWAAQERLARDLIGLADDDFMAELGERFGDQLGALTLAGPRWHYPLSMVQARRYTGRRLALVGDAAHAIHPIAGQGWNLALRDVAALAELLVDAKRLGLDPGSAAVLTRYERWRRFDSLALIAITDGLNRLFGNDLLPLRLARELGLGLVERVGPLKQFFMRHAMGLLGDLPRLMRGEAL
ncbi:MAG TPA: UbiH/UbiF/VisC/COQ6 family ubiquinone biosynthesis hydroxylase [Geminicoccaceae bacterium]|nr:UbiH/UbiF/VisC/COQ6 family ubiquinone biosynthesis hydroxylase [Geminicoccaceae bacterium]